MRNSKAYPWIVVGLLWFVALLNYLDRQMLSTMQSSMQLDIRELAIAENFGRVMGIFLLIYGLMSPVAGMIADRVNRKWLIVGSLFVWSAVTYGLGYAQTFQQVYWLRALMGVSEALYLPTGLAMIADFHTSKTRSLAIGIHMSGLYTGQALGGFGATIAANYSWHTVFHWFGIAGIIYAVVLIFLLHDKEGHASKERAVSRRGQLAAPSGQPSIFRSFGVILGTLSFWIMLFYFMAPSFPGWATKNWLPTLFSGNLGIEMAKAGPWPPSPLPSLHLSVCLSVDRFPTDGYRKISGTNLYEYDRIGAHHPLPCVAGVRRFAYMELVGAAVLFGIGFGMFDTNNMPILCQIIPTIPRHGIRHHEHDGRFAGYAVTLILGSSTDAGNLGADFSKLAIVVLAALLLMLLFLKPKEELTYPEEESRPTDNRKG